MSLDRIVLFVLGTRPEIIKMSPLLRECERRDIPHTIVHTGQHYDQSMDRVFFQQLGIPRPDYNLSIGSHSHGRQTGEMLIALEPVVDSESPAIVLVQGDTNSTLAGALTTSKMRADLGHVEAGLRSYQAGMPEEINRRVTDHVSDLLFAPTDRAVETLHGEGIDGSRVFQTGNTIVDAVQTNMDIAIERSDVLDELGLDPEEYAVLTAHRAENVDDRSNFSSLLEGVDRFSKRTGLQVVYPIHPHPASMVERFDLSVPDGITVVEPLDYLDFLLLQARAALVFTDSGGVQEECCILGVPCVTLRERTERPETLEVGANALVGTDPEAIRETGIRMLDVETGWSNPFGDGTSAQRILSIVERECDG